MRPERARHGQQQLWLRPRLQPPGHEYERRQAIIPDLVASYHPYGSILQANGPPMWELKRAHSVQAFSRDSGLPDGLNDFYCLQNRGRMVRAAGRRADRVPYEYEAKAKRADEAFGAPGSTAVLEALRAILTVRGMPWEHSANLASPSMCLSKASPTKALSRTPTNSARATTRKLMDKSTGG